MKLTPERRQVLLGAAVLVTLTTLAFTPSLTSPFTHYDDPLYVKNNTRVRTPGWEGFALQWDSSAAWSGDFIEYFPLRDSVYWALFHTFGLDTLPYHLTSLFFHLAVSLLLWAFLWQLGMPGRGAWLAGLLFALHPVHIESVVWIAGLKDPMFTSFMMAGLVAYQSYRRQPAPWKYVVMLLGLCAAFLTKSVVVGMPLLLLGLELFFPPRVSLKELALRLTGPFIIAGLFFSQIIGIGRANTVILGPHGGSTMSHVVLMVWAQVKYLKQALLPTSYRLIYCFEPPTGWLDWRLWVGVAMFAVIALLVYRWRKQPLRLFLVGMYAVAMAPVSNLVPFPAIMADRYLYAPSLATCALLALGALALRERFLNVMVVAIAVVLTGATATRAAVWQDEEALWEEPDLDPACVVDTAYPAAQSHVLRFFTAKDRVQGLNALERAMVTPGFKDVGRRLTCTVLIRAAQDAVDLGEPDRATTWAALSTKICLGYPQAWNVAMTVSLHRRPELAAGAATKAWRLEKNPETEVLMWLTRLEIDDPRAAAEVTRLAKLRSPILCGKIFRFAHEVPRLAPALGEAIHVCEEPLEAPPVPGETGP